MICDIPLYGHSPQLDLDHVQFASLYEAVARVAPHSELVRSLRDCVERELFGPLATDELDALRALKQVRFGFAQVSWCT